MSKDEFVKELSGEGFDVGYDSNGVPTVYVEDPSGINRAHKQIKLLIKNVGYDQSYGISILKKKVAMPAEAPKEAVVNG